MLGERIASHFEVIRAIVSGSPTQCAGCMHVRTVLFENRCLHSGGVNRTGRPRKTLVVVAIGETVILLHPSLPLVGVSIVMERERQQNDILVNG